MKTLAEFLADCLKCECDILSSNKQVKDVIQEGIENLVENGIVSAIVVIPNNPASEIYA